MNWSFNTSSNLLEKVFEFFEGQQQGSFGFQPLLKSCKPPKPPKTQAAQGTQSHPETAWSWTEETSALRPPHLLRCPASGPRFDPPSQRRGPASVGSLWDTPHLHRHKQLHCFGYFLSWSNQVLRRLKIASKSRLVPWGLVHTCHAGRRTFPISKKRPRIKCGRRLKNPNLSFSKGANFDLLSSYLSFRTFLITLSDYRDVVTSSRHKVSEPLQFIMTIHPTKTDSWYLRKRTQLRRKGTSCLLKIHHAKAHHIHYLVLAAPAMLLSLDSQPCGTVRKF